MCFSSMSNNMLDMCVGVGEVAVALLLPRAGVAEFLIFIFFMLFFYFLFFMCFLYYVLFVLFFV